MLITDKKRLVLYHAGCIDGFTAAWAAWVHFGDAGTEYIPVQHGQLPPEVKGREVIILDFAYKRDVLLKMNDEAHSLRVIDHHKTAQQDLEGLSFATFDMNRSGAGLAWDLLCVGERPWVVNYVEDRDLWRFELLHSKEVNACISAELSDSFEAFTRFTLLDLGDIVSRGETVLKFIGRYVREMARQARILTFEGFEVPVVNAPYINTSELVGHLAETAPFAVGWFQRADGLIAYSLRSRGEDGVDVSEIAKRYGGGGHCNAAGFQSAVQVIPGAMGRVA